MDKLGIHQIKGRSNVPFVEVKLTAALRLLEPWLILPRPVKLNIKFGRMRRYAGLIYHHTLGHADIEISNVYRWSQFQRTLCHELIHLEQYENELLWKQYWTGLYFGNAPYRKRPWEIQAYAHEQVLLEVLNNGPNNPFIVSKLKNRIRKQNEILRNFQAWCGSRCVRDAIAHHRT